MRIAVVIPTYGLLGGAEAFSYEVTQRLAARPEFEVHVLANRWQRSSGPVNFHKIPSLPFPRFFRPISFAWFVGRSLRQGKYAIVQTHERIFESDVFTLHGIPHKTWVKEVRGKSESLFDKATAWVEKRGISGPEAPVLLPVSELVREEVLKVYAVPKARIRIIYPGVSPDRFAEPYRDKWRAEIRKRHEIRTNDVVILFVGMNFEVKRLDCVLRGFSYLMEKDGNAALKLLVVGKGKTEKYRELSKHLGIQDRVIFAGVVNRVERYYFAGDIFVMPSQFDTFGLVVLEAMAAGLPVIITRRVGARDLVRDGYNGFVLNHNVTPVHLGEKMSSLLDHDMRMKMGEGAKEVASQYTWDRTAQEFATLYHELWGEKKGLRQKDR